MGTRGDDNDDEDSHVYLFSSLWSFCRTEAKTLRREEEKEAREGKGGKSNISWNE